MIQSLGKSGQKRGRGSDAPHSRCPARSAKPRALGLTPATPSVTAALAWLGQDTRRWRKPASGHLQERPGVSAEGFVPWEARSLVRVRQGAAARVARPPIEGRAGASRHSSPGDCHTRCRWESMVLSGSPSAEEAPWTHSTDACPGRLLAGPPTRASVGSPLPGPAGPQLSSLSLAALRARRLACSLQSCCIHHLVQPQEEPRLVILFSSLGKKKQIRGSDLPRPHSHRRRRQDSGPAGPSMASPLLRSTRPALPPPVPAHSHRTGAPP